MFKDKNINTIIDRINDDILTFNRYVYKDGIPIDDGVINIDSNIIEEQNYISTHLSDFELMFKLIDSRNEYEVLNYDDIDSIILVKNNLYNTRMEAIKPIKKNFIRYAINNFKRNKYNINNIIEILDLYIQMRYYNNIQHPILKTGYTNVGTRYRVISSDGNRRVGDTFIATSSEIISIANSVQPLYILLVEKDINKYVIKSIISAVEFDSILREIIIPVGWDLAYIQIQTTDDNLHFDETHDNDNIVRIGNLLYFDNITQYINDISNNNFKNNINCSIESEYKIG